MAVDNVQARIYIDGQWLWNGKPYVEAGTMGTKANSSVVIPGITQWYSDQRDPP